MDLFLAHKNLFIFSWLFLIFLIERISQNFSVPGFKKEGIKRWGKNLAFGLINRLLLPFVTLPIIIFAATHTIFAPTLENNLIIILFNFILLDVISYWFHRLCHQVPFLWRLHETHHLDTALDVTTGLRIHFAELMIANLFRGIFIMLLAIPLKAVIYYEFFVVAIGLFHHTNMKLPKWLDQLLDVIIVTPERHAVHHHAYQPDTDSNYGFIFVWWDWLFGSFNNVKRKENWRIGLEYADDLSLKTLMTAPFAKLTIKQKMTKYA